MKNLELIQFSPNEPQELTLASGISPLALPNGAGSLYTLQDGRLLHLSPNSARSLADLQLQPGESFRICYHQNGRGLGSWDMWLSPETEKARAAVEGEPEEALTRQLAASIELVNRRRSTVAAVSDRAPSSLAPTGTEGPHALPDLVPTRKPAIAAVAGSRSGKPGPIPLNVARYRRNYPPGLLDAQLPLAAS